MKVLLVYPPFITGYFPASGLSLLKSVLMQHNIKTEILYANLLFSKGMYPGLYERYLGSLNFNNFLLGEYLFAPYAFPAAPPRDPDFTGKYSKELVYYRQYLLRNQCLPLDEIEQFRQRIPAFLDEVCCLINDHKPDIVGFSILSHQLCAALALANRIKEQQPGMTTIAGGWLCNQPMGKAILQIAPSFDYLFSGEAETALPAFCRDLEMGKLPPDRQILCKPLRNLDQVPFPNYYDYFHQIKEFNLRPYRRILPFHTSRGCWWGKCIFCGEEHTAGNFRQKSEQRIIEEFEHLAAAYQPSRMDVHDYTASPHLLKAFTHPAFRNTAKIKLFMELRAEQDFLSLSRLKKNGLQRCQVGIECLNDRLLRILKKGATAARNLRLLRDCKLLGIDVIWGFIIRIPGERRKDYLAMLQLIGRISHLAPPCSLHPFVLTRYSAILKNYRKYKIKDLQPFSLLSAIFPATADLENLTPYFSGHYPAAIDDPGLRSDFLAAINGWIASHGKQQPQLRLYQLGRGPFLMSDTRPASCPGFKVLNLLHFNALQSLREPLTRKQLKLLTAKPRQAAALRELLAAGYVVPAGSQYISLVCEPYRLLGGVRKPGRHDTPLPAATAALLEDRLNRDADAFTRFKESPREFLAACQIRIDEEELQYLQAQFDLQQQQTSGMNRRKVYS